MHAQDSLQQADMAVAQAGMAEDWRMVADSWALKILGSVDLDQSNSRQPPGDYRNTKHIYLESARNNSNRTPHGNVFAIGEQK